jgi:RNA polymerase sigma-70 factor (ECF subfamily)
MQRSVANFEVVAMPHSRSLLRFALRLTRSPAEAEDLVQETLLAAWNGFPRFEEGTNARAWLFRILINASNTRYRRGPRGQVVELPKDLAAERGPDSVEVSQALERLGPDQREVLLLAVIEGFTCREISEILSIPMGTVMSRLSRARDAMRETLTMRAGANQ